MAEVFARKDPSMTGAFRRRVGAVTADIKAAANRKVEDFTKNVGQEEERKKREGLVSLIAETGRRGFLPRDVIKTQQGFALAVTVDRLLGGKIVLWDGAFYNGTQEDESAPPQLGEKIDTEDVLDEVLAQTEKDYDEHPSGHGRIKTYPGLYPVKSSSIFHKVKIQEPGPYKGRRPAPDYIPVGNRQELLDAPNMIGCFSATEERVLKAESPEEAVIETMRDARGGGFISTSVELFMDGAWNAVDLDALEAKFAAAQNL